MVTPLPDRIVSEPGFFAFTADLYHADPCPEPSLSCSIAKLLVTRGSTPLHAWFEHPRLNPAYAPEEEQKFDLGKAAHSLMLKDPQEFEIVDAPDWRTKAAQERREVARIAGKIPLLAHQFKEAQAMVEAADAQLDGHEEGSEFFVEGHGWPERTMIWREGDVWCRARLDWLPEIPKLYPDYKSTSASADPRVWQNAAFANGFDIQASFYCRGLRALGIDKPEFRFVVQENYAPYALSVIQLSPGLIDLADRKVELAIEIWRACVRDNVWPGYGTHTAHIETRAWDEADFLSLSASYEDLCALARESQAPL
jgi:hypothetical protein